MTAHPDYLFDTALAVLQDSAGLWVAQARADYTILPTRSADAGLVLNAAFAVLTSGDRSLRVLGQLSCITPVVVPAGVGVRGTGYVKTKSTADGGSNQRSAILAANGFAVGSNLVTLNGYGASLHDLEVDAQGRANAAVALNAAVQTNTLEMVAAKGGINYGLYNPGADQMKLIGGLYRGAAQSAIFVASGSDGRYLNVEVEGDQGDGKANASGVVYHGGSTYTIGGTNHWDIGGNGSAGVVIDGDRNTIAGLIFDSGPTQEAFGGNVCQLHNKSGRNMYTGIEFFYNSTGTPGDAIWQASTKPIAVNGATCTVGNNALANYGYFLNRVSGAGQIRLNMIDANNITQANIWSAAPDYYAGVFRNGTFVP